MVVVVVVAAMWLLALGGPVSITSPMVMRSAVLDGISLLDFFGSDSELLDLKLRHTCHMSRRITSFTLPTPPPPCAPRISHSVLSAGKLSSLLQLTKLMQRSTFCHSELTATVWRCVDSFRCASRLS